MQFDIYCDESRQDLLVTPKSIGEHNRFCCIGGLMLPSEYRPKIKESLKILRTEHKVNGELRWGTVSNNKLPFYLELIDLFFSVPELSFKTVLIDASKINNEVFNNSDQELGYYKFYYQLLSHWIEPNGTYRVFTDQKTNRDKQRLKELQRILNLLQGTTSPIEIIQAIDSRESLLLQFENIIMGAVGYKFNYQNDGLSKAKSAVVACIEKYLGHEIAATMRSEAKLNIFAIELREAH